MKKYTKSPRWIADFEDEMSMTAMQIRDELEGSIDIASNGGVLSMAIIKCFMDENIDFSVISHNFSDLKNPELKNIKIFCQIHEIEHRIIPVNIKKFFTTQTFYKKNLIEHMSDNYRLRGAGQAIYTYLGRRTQKDNIVVPIGFPWIDINTTHVSLKYMEDWNNTSEWFLHNHIKGVAFFEENSMIFASTLVKMLQDMNFRLAMKLKFKNWRAENKLYPEKGFFAQLNPSNSLPRLLSNIIQGNFQAQNWRNDLERRATRYNPNIGWNRDKMQNIEISEILQKIVPFQQMNMFDKLYSDVVIKLMNAKR